MRLFKTFSTQIITIIQLGNFLVKKDSQNKNIILRILFWN